MIIETSWSKLLNWEDVEDQYEKEDDIPLAQLIPSNRTYLSIAEETQRLLEELAPEANISSYDVCDWNNDEILELEEVTESDVSSDNDKADVQEFIPHSNDLYYSLTHIYTHMHTSYTMSLKS